MPAHTPHRQDQKGPFLESTSPVLFQPNPDKTNSPDNSGAESQGEDSQASEDSESKLDNEMVIKNIGDEGDSDASNEHEDQEKDEMEGIKEESEESDQGKEELPSLQSANNLLSTSSPHQLEGADGNNSLLLSPHISMHVPSSASMQVNVPSEEEFDTMEDTLRDDEEDFSAKPDDESHMSLPIEGTTLEDDSEELPDTLVHAESHVEEPMEASGSNSAPSSPKSLSHTSRNSSKEEILINEPVEEKAESDAANVVEEHSDGLRSGDSAPSSPKPLSKSSRSSSTSSSKSSLASEPKEQQEIGSTGTYSTWLGVIFRNNAL